MIPVLDVAAMREADAAAIAASSLDALITRAGTAVGVVAMDYLGAGYGRRASVISGPGHNGDDGRVAAAWLRRHGVVVSEYDVGSVPRFLDDDIVIDAAFGVGCSRPYVAPSVGPDTIVVAVDLPSGVDADTGELWGRPMVADVTVAIGALKVAHLFGPAREFVGDLRLAPCGIEAPATMALVDDDDVRHLVRSGSRDHKWHYAVALVAGSASMPGAAVLATMGALAGGASLAQVTIPSLRPAHYPDLPPEAVRLPMRRRELVDLAIGPNTRYAAVVVGPGLGRSLATGVAVDDIVARCAVPLVLDADALRVVSCARLAERQLPTVLTPHDGEFEGLMGTRPGSDRIGAARALAKATGATVLLKGPETVVANAAGEVRVITSGTSALATAGSGDVLAGLIGATLARGHDPLEAAALAAHWHGRAGRLLDPYATASALAPALTHFLRELSYAS
jgi:NAD(P)H-hydrate epimerase